MGRKDKKNNLVLKAKKEAKAEKAAQKRLRKEAAEDGVEKDTEHDLDGMISTFTKLDVNHPVIEPMTGFPSPRASFSLTVLPNNDVLMFGGEFFNGAENVVYDDLFQWNPECANGDDDCDDDDGIQISRKKCGEWKRIHCPSPKPKPRCAHSAVLYNNDIYVFGGEVATIDQFHHYRDFWKYSPKTHLWSQIEPRTPGPSARSGHRCIVWRHYMVLFGGFHEALRDTPRWFHDLWIYDFSQNSWTECKYSKLTSMPDARSGFVFALQQDTAVIYGGFSKVKNPGDISEGKIHTDCWTLNLKPFLSSGEGGGGGLPSWNRQSRKGEYPSARTSMSGIVHKKRLLVYGGVFDEEKDNHVVSSVFYDDLFALDLEKNRWFKMNMKKMATTKKSRRKVKEDATTVSQVTPDNDEADDDEYDECIEGEAQSNGWGLDELKARMFAEEESSNEMLGKVQESSEEEEERKDDPSENKLTHRQQPENVAPLPRIKPALILRNNTLYLYGGLLEVGAREVTLDDVWALDLQKRERWVCIYEGSMGQQVWKGELESDSESHISSSMNNDDDSSTDEDEEDEYYPEISMGASIVSKKESSSTKHSQRGKEEEKNVRNSKHSDEMERLKSELEFNDVNSTPLVSESLADFYARTSKLWTLKAGKNSDNGSLMMADKELKTLGFDLARERYLDMKPILDRIRELQRAETESKSSKKNKKKEDKQSTPYIQTDRKQRAK